MRSGRLYKSIKHSFGEIGSWSGFAIAVLASLFYGWFPDSIKDILEKFLPDVWTSITLLVLSLLIVVILFLWIKRIVRKITSLKYEVETYDAGELRGIKALVMGLSIPRQDPQLGHNWSQQETLIKECLLKGAKLRKIILLPSPGSAEYVSEFLDYIRGKTGVDSSIVHFEEPVEYEDMLTLQKVFNRIVDNLKSEGFKEREVLVDITAGTKTFSVVASSITFDNDIRMCYVKNTKEVIIFDMVAVRED
ncbi:MAG: hypothetical protein ACK42C_03855 [Aquificaceae bacterium]|uniref:hypothetical protein n=1 Tax=Hydrogenobacter sp. Uz 6-8 TaxID=3384828 RepID=UPI0030A301B7